MRARAIAARYQRSISATSPNEHLLLFSFLFLLPMSKRTIGSGLQQFLPVPISGHSLFHRRQPRHRERRIKKPRRRRRKSKETKRRREQNKKKHCCAHGTLTIGSSVHLFPSTCATASGRLTGDANRSTSPRLVLRSFSFQRRPT